MLKDFLLYALLLISCALIEFRTPLVTCASGHFAFEFVPFQRIMILFGASYPVLTAMIFTNKMIAFTQTTKGKIDMCNESVSINKSLIAFEKLQRSFNTILRYYFILTVMLEFFAICNVSRKQPDLLFTVIFWRVNAVHVAVIVTNTVVLIFLLRSQQSKMAQVHRIRHGCLRDAILFFNPKKFIVYEV